MNDKKTFPVRNREKIVNLNSLTMLLVNLLLTAAVSLCKWLAMCSMLSMTFGKVPLVLVVVLVVVGILCSVAKHVFTAIKYLFIVLRYVVTASIQIVVFVICKLTEVFFVGKSCVVCVERSCSLW